MCIIEYIKGLTQKNTSNDSSGIFVGGAKKILTDISNHNEKNSGVIIIIPRVNIGPKRNDGLKRTKSRSQYITTNII